jgi:murein DD-endopeptidase MepM/ murein hydrolase activator NlpD
MTVSKSRQLGKAPVVILVLLVLVAAIGAGIYFLRPRFESAPPQVSFKPDTDVLGLGSNVEIAITDAGMGLAQWSATLSSGGAEQSLGSEDLREPLREKRLAFTPASLKGLKEGPATLRIRARDASWGNSFGGNEAVVERTFTIDTTPPAVELLADDRYVTFGGVGAIVYKASEDAVTSGVKVGERFFPGFKGVVNGQPAHHFALFAHPYDAKPDTRATIVATDKAGNTRQVALAYEVKNVKYRKSTIAITDAFLRNKVAPLVADASARQGAPKDIFVAVNRALRKQNEDKIAEVTAKATPAIQWKGAFSQLSNSKVEANFADERTYTWEKQPVDTAYHVGYDLSVTKHYPVEAANSGTVTFAGDLGIYGNTVILDHGLGLHTLYSHLSSIDVKVGDTVSARQPLGKTGETGLAAGDHLHYGVYLSGVAVLPVEWWEVDPRQRPAEAGRRRGATPGAA